MKMPPSLIVVIECRDGDDDGGGDNDGSDDYDDGGLSTILMSRISNWTTSAQKKY